MDFREMQDRFNAEKRMVTEDRIVVGGLFRTVLTVKRRTQIQRRTDKQAKTFGDSWHWQDQ